MPFRFRLQPLLDHRARIAEEKLREYATAERARLAALAELDRLESEREKAHENLRRPTRQTAATLQMLNQFIEDVKQRIGRQRGAIAAAEDAAERAQDVLRAANLDKKVLETLRAGQQKAYLEQQEMLELRDFDEANMSLNENRRRARAAKATPA